MITSQSKQSSNHLAELDSLRALAVLAVLLYHINDSWLPGGFTGVDIFFVISGYIVTRATLQHSSEANLSTILSFFARRLKRITPALVVCLVVTSLMTTLFIPVSWLSQSISQTGLYAFVGLSNIALVLSNDGYFSPRIEFNPFTHTWSLAVEEQFYLIFPFLLLLILFSLSRGTRWKTASYSLISVCTIASFFIAIQQTPDSPNKAFYWLPSRFWELGIGVLLSLYHLSRLEEKPTAVDRACLPAGLCLIGLGFIYSEHFLFPFPWALLPTLGTLLLINAIHTRFRNNLPQGIFSHPWARYIGLISYSLYLWHWPVYVLFRWTIGLDTPSQKLGAITLSLGLAILSYELIEQRFKKLKIASNKHALKTITISILILTTCFFSSYSLFKYQNNISLSVTRNTNDWYPYPQTEERTGSPFLYRNKQIFAVGDSHLGAYSTLLNQARNQLELRIDEYHLGGCPMVNFMYKLYNRPDCKEKTRKILNNILEKSSPGDIVLFTSLQAMRLTDQWTKLDVQGLSKYIHSDVGGTVLKTAYDDAKLIVTTLSDSGLYVIVDVPKPTLKAPPYRCSDWFNQDNPICSEGSSISRIEMEHLRKPILRSMQEMQKENTNFHLWDSFSVLCPGKVCTSHINNRPLYFDADHLSGYGNKVLYPSFKQLLTDIWSNHYVKQ